MQPKLRQVETHLVEHQGQPAILLRDPLRLSDQVVFVPLPLALLLELCDGTRDEAGLRAALEVRAGIRIPPETMKRILTQLDEALLLESDRFAEAYAAAIQGFRAAPSRSPVMAGNSYPADPEELKEALKRYFEAAQDVKPRAHIPLDGDVRGLICPHIDFQRGGAVYAQVWEKAAKAVRSAEVAIVFGTDHVGGEARLTLTRQHYATPWGMLPTVQAIVDEVSHAIGPQAAFQDELHHRSEHSIELAIVWLHYLLGDQQCELVPILCGSFDHFMKGEESPGQDARIAATIEALKKATASYRTIVIAAADLAHMGPAFGDPYPIDFVGRARLRTADERLMEIICTGDAEDFFQEIKGEGDRRKICGLPPIYTALRFLEGAEGVVSAYAQCPADERGASFVSICGVVLK